MNPVFQKEARLALRDPRLAVAAAAYVVALAALVWWIWPDAGVFSAAAQASRTVVVLFAGVLLLAVVLFAPALSAVAFVSERENHSYDLLLASRLSPREIVAGKLGASLAVLGLLVALSVPFFAACFFLGAASVPEALRLYGLAAATALVAGLAGLAVSLGARDSQAALARTYLAVLAWTGGPWLLHLVLANRASLSGPAYLLRALSPFAAAASLLRPGDRAWDASAVGLWPAWQVYLAFAAAASAGLLAYLLAGAGRPPAAPRRGPERLIDDRAELQRRRLRFPFYLVDPQRRKRNLPDWVNPVFAREIRGRAFGGGVWVFRAIIACFAVSALLVILIAGQVGGQSPDGFKGFALAFQLGLVLLLAPALTAASITQERELRNVDLLRLSRIGPATLLAGKLATALIFVALLMTGSFPLWLVIGAMQLNSPSELAVCWAIVAATILLALMAGFLGSAVARRSAVATGLAYALLLAVGVLTLAPFLLPGRFAPGVVDAASRLNPFLCAWFVLCTDPFRPAQEFWIPHLKFSLGLSAVLGAIVYARVCQLFRPER